MNIIIKIKSLKEMLDNSENGYEEDFVNWFFDNYCIPECGVECNNHYEEGPFSNIMIGCLIRFYNEDEILNIINDIKYKVNNGFIWEGKWKKTK